MGITRRAENLARKAATKLLDLEIQSRKLPDGTVVGRRVEGLERAERGGLNHIGDRVRFVGDGVRLGLGSTVHSECLLYGPIGIGNYCQIAPRTSSFPQDHPVRHVTPYTAEALFDGGLGIHMETEEIVVGHGVWIGANSILLKGARIGNGAIVGAGAVVGGEVPPYAIAVGAPARVVRSRLPADVIQVIESSQWWARHPDELEPFRAFFDLELTRMTSAERAGFEAVGRDIARLRLPSDR